MLSQVSTGFNKIQLIELLISLVLVYHPESLPDVLIAIEKDTRIACLVVYGSAPHSLRVPVMAHLPSSAEKAKGTANLSVFTYESASPHFVLPHVDDYVPPFASLAHSRNVPFWRKHLGGPYFDIEAIWEEHTYFEFETRSVAHTMGTMVVRAMKCFLHALKLKSCDRLSRMLTMSLP